MRRVPSCQFILNTSQAVPITITPAVSTGIFLRLVLPVARLLTGLCSALLSGTPFLLPSVLKQFLFARTQAACWAGRRWAINLHALILRLLRRVVAIVNLTRCVRPSVNVCLGGSHEQQQHGAYQQVTAGRRVWRQRRSMGTVQQSETQSIDN